MRRDPPIRFAAVGCGGFGRFALEHFAEVEEARLVAVCEARSEPARRAARLLGVGEPVPFDRVLADPDVDMVYVNTPPHLHHPQARAALLASKHALVEKPLALTLEQADELIGIARERNLVLGVHQMQRHARLVEAVGRLLEWRPLGGILAADFWNCASDENLPPEHWFWDRERSGGIFVEHAVHFFDVFASWFDPIAGEGRVVSAHRSLRPGTAMEEHVECTVRHGDHLLARQMHSFTQAGRLDRQRWRLLFERGDVLLEEWIPTRVRIHALADEDAVRILRDLFPGSRVEVQRWFAPGESDVRARGRSFEVWQEIVLAAGDERRKFEVYGDAIRGWFRDQIAAMLDPSHRRRVTDLDGRRALAAALAARERADREREEWSG